MVPAGRQILVPLSDAQTRGGRAANYLAKRQNPVFALRFAAVGAQPSRPRQVGRRRSPMLGWAGEKNRPKPCFTLAMSGVTAECVAWRPQMCVRAAPGLN